MVLQHDAQLILSDVIYMKPLPKLLGTHHAKPRQAS